MSRQLGELLEHVLSGEPEMGDEVDEVFRQADRLRRRRTRWLLVTGAATVAGIVAIGYLIATMLFPATAAPVPAAVRPSAVPVPSAIADPVLAVLAPVVDRKGMRILPRPPERGNGWRQYTVLDRDGRPRGTVEVAVYDATETLCFPVLAEAGACARPERIDGVEYLRYDDDQDADWQVHQTIARRVSDGRTVALMATGERGTDNASRGRPALTGAEIERLATDERLVAAFGPAERCAGPSAGACPVFRVPVPVPD